MNDSVDIAELRLARSEKLYAKLLTSEHEKPKSRMGLIGKKFGRLTVISDTERNKRWQTLCWCRCDCGGFKTTIAARLKAGRTRSCGCLYKETRVCNFPIYRERLRADPTIAYNFNNMAGKQVGRLTVISIAGLVKGQGFRWFCECQCGEYKIICGNSLQKGVTQSCGCLQRERSTASNKARAAARRAASGNVSIPIMLFFIALELLVFAAVWSHCHV